MIGVRIFLLSLVLAACSSSAEPAPQIPIGTEVGERAPELAGMLHANEPFALSTGGAGVKTVLVFYRSANCGLCRTQLEQLQQYLPAYRRQGARVVAVTLDPPEVSRTLAEQAGLEYDLVSVDAETFTAWGVMTQELGGPMPATYIVDGEGLVRYRRIGRNAADRTTDPELLTIVSGL